jgi:hypothetical protein
VSRLRLFPLVGVLGIAVALSACGSGGETAEADGCQYAPASGAASDPYSPNPPDTNGDPVGQAIPEMPHNHVGQPTKIQYNHNPPTSGCHYSIGGGQAPVLHGVYNKEIAPEYWVHNLEHGYIVVLYNCATACDTEFQQLRDWAGKMPADPPLVDYANSPQGQQQKFVPYSKLLVLPYKGMEKKFAVVSWDWYQGFDTLDISGLQKFYDNHVGHAPEGLISV